MNSLLISFTSLIFTLFLTPLFINYLIKSKVVDVPDSRRVNTITVPRMGGLVIFIITFIMIFSFYKDLNSIRFFILGAMAVLFCGIFDDMLGLEWSSKFALQAIAALMLIINLFPKFTHISIFFIDIPTPLNYVILFVFIIGAINSINLLDGLDGLVSGFSMLVFSIVIALAFAANDNFLIILSAALLGSLLGFLKFNAFPAKIFLGDTGSLSLGYFLITTTLLTSIDFNAGDLDLTFPFMALGVPMIDTMKVMSLRMMQKNNPFLPDKTHLHHIIFGNLNHKTTVFVIESFTLVFLIISLYYLMVGKFYALIIFFILAFSLLLIKPILRISSKAEQLSLYTEKFMRIPEAIIGLFKKFLINISSVLIAFIIISLIPVHTTLLKNHLLLLIFVGVVMFVIAVSQQKISTIINDINVFINFTVFFIVTRLSVPFLFEPAENILYLSPATEISFYILSCIIILFILAREKIFRVKEMFLTGIDLTMIVFISLTFIVNNFIKVEMIQHVSRSLVFAFIFYMWYKIIKYIRAESAGYLFYFSFAVPFFSMLLLLIFN
ncbi:MAG TPA: MraY family glycosyltransferase [Ignavibacteriales bacterium]|nr:MraY family glycosyltransferase [Ignavibacteriales bacterium]